MKTIIRKRYLERMKALKDTPDIKIITGIRRSGKSNLMQVYIEYLKENFKDANIIFIDYMDLDFEEIKEYHALHKYVEERYDKEKKNYLFVDEVQLCPKFELAINSLYSKNKYDIYVTGSNAFLLSADLDRTTYIKEVYETIVNRDLVQKYNLPDTQVLRQLSEFLMDNISNLTSPNKISDILKAHDVATNHVTIGKYIKYLCTAFVFYDIKRYDIRGKKYLETSDKFYMCDTGMRYAILGSRNMDYGRVYENIVCVELLRRGYSPLLQIRDAFPKMIIARTKHPKYTYEGVEVCDIVEWLLDES